MSEQRVRTCQVVDELTAEDGAVVLLAGAAGHLLVRLSVLGQVIRELAADGITTSRLAEEVELRIGPPPQGDVAELVAAAVAELERDGLVTIEP